MAIRTWETIKVRYCDRACNQVGLEVELVYPSEWMPNEQPRVLAHRCTHGMLCNLDERATCLWAGTNPLVNPFDEK